MAKYCVFCGAVPEKKNKEHVVPKWLIKLTGNPKREAYFGFEKNIETEVKTRTFAFDQFSFPACSWRKYSSSQFIAVILAKFPAL